MCVGVCIGLAICEVCVCMRVCVCAYVYSLKCSLLNVQVFMSLIS